VRSTYADSTRAAQYDVAQVQRPSRRVQRDLARLCRSSSIVPARTERFWSSDRDRPGRTSSWAADWIVLYRPLRLLRRDWRMLALPRKAWWGISGMVGALL